MLTDNRCADGQTGGRPDILNIMHSYPQNFLGRTSMLFMTVSRGQKRDYNKTSKIQNSDFSKYKLILNKFGTCWRFRE